MLPGIQKMGCETTMEILLFVPETPGYRVHFLTMIRRKAACASGVTASASSRIMILNGGLGYFLYSSSSSVSIALEVLKKFFLEAGAVPTERLAKCLILSRTTDIPRSSLAFNSRMRRRN